MSTSPGENVFLPKPAMMPLFYTVTQEVPLYTIRPYAVEYETIPADGLGIAVSRVAVPENTITI